MTEHRSVYGYESNLPEPVGEIGFLHKPEPLCHAIRHDQDKIAAIIVGELGVCVQKEVFRSAVTATIKKQSYTPSLMVSPC